MSHSFIFCELRLEMKYTPMSFSGVSMSASRSLASVLIPMPGMSLRLQSCSGREMNVLNFLVFDSVMGYFRMYAFLYVVCI